VIDDLIQDTYLKLCEDRDRFSERFKPAHPGAVFGYIKVFTANLAHDHFKLANSQKRGGGTKAASIDGLESGQVGPEMSARAILDRDVLIQQIDTCLQELASGPESERDRKIFWLYYRVGLTASAIAALPSVGLTTKGVESLLFRLTCMIRKAVIREGPSASEDSKKGIHKL
jgi:RNA polymerase sigma-70 factor (ECF subfamily)